MKKKNYLKRITSLLLTLVLLMGCASCQLEREDNPDNTSEITDQRLVVETVSVTYSEEQKAYFSRTLALNMSRALAILDGLNLNETQILEITQLICENILPIAQNIGVSELEMKELCSIFEKFVANMEEGTSTRSVRYRLSEVCTFYQDILSVLGSNRTGEMLFELLLLWVDDRIESYEARYEEYGFEWLLEDAQRYREQRRELTEEMGKERFVLGSEAVLFGLSIFSGAVSFPFEETDQILLNNSELLFLIQKQAERFASLDISESQWSLCFELLIDWIPQHYLIPDSLERMEKDELLALLRSDLKQELGACMPSFLRLYSKALKSLNPDDVSVIFSGDRALYAMIGCRALSGCKAEFLSFTDSIERFALASEEEASAIQNAGKWDAYLSFADTQNDVTAEGLFSQVEALSREMSADGLKQLKKDAVSYLYGIFPYFTFVFLSE